MQALEMAEAIRSGEFWYVTDSIPTINQVVYTIGTTVIGASIGYVGSVVVVFASHSPTWIRYRSGENPIVNLIYASVIFGALAGAYYGSSS